MKVPLLITLLIAVNLFAGHTGATDIVVKDYLGNEIVLKNPARRIVGLSPHIIENLFAAGAGDLLVGAVEYADYPKAALKLPRVGGFASINLENLLTLQPDLVVAWGSGNGQAVIAQIRELNIPVYIDEPKHLTDIARSLGDMGVLSGRQQQAQLAADQFLQQLEQIKHSYSEKQTVSVLYQIWHSPIQTVNGAHLISNVIRLCGGENVFGDAIVEAPIINRETVIQRNPEVIIASGADNHRPAWLDNWQEWPSLQAVKNNHLYYIPPDLLQRHTTRILIGARRLCDQLQIVRDQSP